MTYFYSDHKIRIPLNKRLHFIIILLFSTLVHANIPKLTYQKCGMIAREYITGVQLYQKGFTLKTLKKTLPGLTPKGAELLTDIYQAIKKDGVLSTYSTIHSKYAQCAKSVYQKKHIPSRSSTEYGYYYCAGENKLRYEIALAIYLKGTPKEVLHQIPKQRRAVASYYFQVARKKGIEAVFNILAHSLKSCLIRVRPASSLK